MEKHISHLDQVLKVLRKEYLYVKKSMGYIITGKESLQTKIKAMVSRPTPKSLKSLRGFLGLTGYYIRFIKNYGLIRKPLTNYPKKNSCPQGETKLAF